MRFGDTIRFLYAGDNRIAITEIITFQLPVASGFETADTVIAVAVTAPSPVDIKLITAVVPVDDKFVSSGSISTIKDRTPRSRLCLENGYPIGVRHIVACIITHSVVVTKIFLKGKEGG